MTSHRADTQNISVLPRQFRWRKALPDVETWVAITVGFTFGVFVLLMLLSSIVTGIDTITILAGAAWAVASITFIWMKETDGRR